MERMNVCVCMCDLFVRVAIKRLRPEIEEMEPVLLSNSQLGLD